MGPDRTAILLIAPLATALLGATPVKATEVAGIEEAIPADATMALYLRRIDPGLARSIELLARLFGVEVAEEFLHDAPLPLLALRTAENGQQHGIDPAKGLGLFRSPAFDGLVGVVGVSDAKKATRAVADLLVRRGGKRLKAKAGLARVELDGIECAIATARGYLYLFMQTGELPLLPSLSDATRDPQRLAASLRAKMPGLDGNARVQQFEVRARGADLFLYVDAPFSRDSDLVDAFFAADLRLGEVQLDGFAGVRGDVWPTDSVATPFVATSVDGEPFGYALIGAPLGRLVSLVAGNPGTPRRVRTSRALKQSGIDLEAWLAAIPGPLTMRAFATPDAVLPTLTLLSEAPIAREVDALLEDQLARTLPYQRVRGADGRLVYVTSLLGQPVTASVEGGRLRVIAGQGLELADAPPAIPITPGTVRLMLDLKALEQTVSADQWLWLGPDSGEAVEPPPVGPFARGALEISPAPGGLRIRGVLLPDDPGDPLEQRR